MSGKEYYVYVASNEARTLYTGVTCDLLRRMWQHKHKALVGFISRYGI
ncbi:MAG: GIY-YIG nuclease family protein [Dehalococcoidales bacterium]|nr:GIY-YIG nuclease family protein [Dehalococcoidales bacterium]